MTPQTKKRLKQLRRFRIRKKLAGTKERPRMAVCFTNEHIYVQFIDDQHGLTLRAIKGDYAYVVSTDGHGRWVPAPRSSSRARPAGRVAR